MDIEYYEYFILNNNSEISPGIASDIRFLENENFLTILNAENSLIERWIQEEEMFCTIPYSSGLLQKIFATAYVSKILN